MLIGGDPPAKGLESSGSPAVRSSRSLCPAQVRRQVALHVLTLVDVAVRDGRLRDGRPSDGRKLK